jgi:hypothetical protein
MIESHAVQCTLRSPTEPDLLCAAESRRDADR